MTIVYYKKFVSHVNPLLVNAVQLSMGFAFISAVTLALRNALEFNFSTQYASSLIVPVVAAMFGWILLGENISPFHF